MRHLATLMAALGSTIALAQTPVPGKAKEAVTEIVRLLDQHRVVMLGEIHGSIQFDGLVKKLVSTPAFAERGLDVVAEMGNAYHQDIPDRYISGGDVSINWSRVESRDDVEPFLPFRGDHYASVVRYEVLAKRRKALLIMGSGHFQRRLGTPGLIEQSMLSAFVKPNVIVAGSNVVRTFDDVDPRFAAVGDPPPPWIMEMKGTWLASLPRWTDSPPIGFPAPADRGTQSGTWDQVADPFLFLGPRDKLTSDGSVRPLFQRVTPTRPALPPKPPPP
jgi:hypothetical protein